MINVLFVCVHNSARSQLAEEYLRKLGGDRFAVESAGLEPGILNPYVAEEKCPIFPGAVVRYNWPFDDPSRFEGSREEILDRTRAVAGAIKRRIREFVDTVD